MYLCISNFSIQVAQLTFDHFDTKDSPECVRDGLAVYNSDKPSSEYKLESFCGRTIPPVVTSGRHSLFLRFKSDSLGYGGGFSAVYHKINKTGVNINLIMSTVGVFVEVKKAFDTIDHGILWKKLEQNGIMGMAIQWVLNYLTEIFLYVQYNNISSGYMSIKCGASGVNTRANFIFTNICQVSIIIKMNQYSLLITPSCFILEMIFLIHVIP